MKNRTAIVLTAGFAILLTISCSLLGGRRGALRFQPEALPEAVVGLPYEAKITISDNVTPAGQFSISEGALPAGLKLEKVEGSDAARISGTPQVAGTFVFKVYVWCYGTNVNGQTGEMEYSLVVR